MSERNTKHTTVASDRDMIRSMYAAPAWRLWTMLARSDAMAGNDGRDVLLERHKIVVALIEVNSQQLRCDNATAGLDVERLTAERDAKLLGDTAETRDALAAIEKRTAENDGKKRKLRLEREWLERSLAEFDALLPPDKPQTSGRA